MFTNEEKIENYSFLSLITDGVLICRLEVENHVTNRTNFTKSDVTILADKMDLHQHRDKCSAAFIFRAQFSSDSAIRTYEAIQNLENYVKKDEDYFIFITNEESFSHILLHPRISEGIKYKLCIPSSLMQPIAFTACLYCNSGMSTVIPVNIADSSFDEIFPDLLNNFHGKTMRISVPMFSPRLTEIQKINGTWQSDRGIFNTILKTFMVQYNFTCEYFPSTGGGTGMQLENGSWIGVVGDVLSYAADIGQVNGQTWSRNKMVGYTFPITYEWLTFTTAEPVPYYSWRAVYWPLGNFVWLGVIGSSLATFLLLLLVLKVKSQKQGPSVVAEYLFRSLVDQGRNPLETSSQWNGKALFCG